MHVTRTAARDHRRGLVLIGVATVLTGLTPRTAVTSVGPVVREIRDRLGSSSGLTGPVVRAAAPGWFMTRERYVDDEVDRFVPGGSSTEHCEDVLGSAGAEPPVSAHVAVHP